MKINTNIIHLLLFLSLFPGFGASALAQERAVVLNVIDGDTLKIDYQGQKESLRLIGVDAPENRFSRKAEKDGAWSGESLITIASMGIEAADFTKSLAKKGDTITIELDVEQRDKYRKLLGYVFLPDGKMLNEELLKAGYADLTTQQPNIKYLERFIKAYKEAKENKRGFWR